MQDLVQVVAHLNLPAAQGAKYRDETTELSVDKALGCPQQNPKSPKNLAP